ncbi:hypothetical protein BGW42_002536 [Actinomortierella wolfii]|nr:hypothetical protein BGW42_002536 [Actinomortierella wolfii]
MTRCSRRFPSPLKSFESPLSTRMLGARLPATCRVSGRSDTNTPRLVQTTRRLQITESQFYRTITTTLPRNISSTSVDHSDASPSSPPSPSPRPSTSPTTTATTKRSLRSSRTDLTIDDLLRLGQLVRELDPQVGKDWQELTSQHFPKRSYRSLADKVALLRKQAANEAFATANGDDEDDLDKSLAQHSFRITFERAILRNGDLDWVAIKNDLLDAERLYQQAVAALIRQAERGSNAASPTSRSLSARATRAEIDRIKRKFVFFPMRREWLRYIWAQWHSNCTNTWTPSELELLEKMVKAERSKYQEQQQSNTPNQVGKDQQDSVASIDDDDDELPPDAWIEIGRHFAEKSSYQCQIKWMALTQGGTDSELYAEILRSVWDVDMYKGRRLDHILQVQTTARGKPIAVTLAEVDPCLLPPSPSSSSLPWLSSPSSLENSNNTPTVDTNAGAIAHSSPTLPRASKLLAALLMPIKSRPLSEAQWDDYSGYDARTDSWTRHEMGLMLQAVEMYGTHYTTFERVGELLGMDTVRVMCQWFLSGQDEYAEMTSLTEGRGHGDTAGQQDTDTESDTDVTSTAAAATTATTATNTTTSSTTMTASNSTSSSFPRKGQSWTPEMDACLIEALQNRDPNEPMKEVYRRVTERFGLSPFSASNRHRRLRQKKATPD